jgi:glycerophosphoryl diester phosphodiesterase
MIKKGLPIWLLTSFTLFQVPHYVHGSIPHAKPPKRGEKPSIMARRCGLLDSVENTVPAALKSIQNGCDIIQVDLRLSKDKVPVMLYNRDLGRICANGKFVDRFDFDKLPKISPKIYRHPIISSV